MDSSMAIDRIRDEMAREHTNPLITQVGEYVTNVLLSYPEEAEHVTDSKHLSQCFEEIYKYASAHRLTILGGKQAAYVGPEETAQIIDKYYGFTKGGAWACFGPKTSEDHPADDQVIHSDGDKPVDNAPALHLVPDDTQTEVNTPMSADVSKNPTDTNQGKAQTSADLGMLDLDDLLAGL